MKVKAIAKLVAVVVDCHKTLAALRLRHQRESLTLVFCFVLFDVLFNELIVSAIVAVLPLIAFYDLLARDPVQKWNILPNSLLDDSHTFSSTSCCVISTGTNLPAHEIFVTI